MKAPDSFIRALGASEERAAVMAWLRKAATTLHGHPPERFASPDARRERVAELEWCMSNIATGEHVK